uniref:CSON010239 protein n=1 Tax=Culicoides sonorensis TaxID=179676 RepID=A0A336N3P6_CULSO
MGFLSKWLPNACGTLGPALIPPAHIAILYYFWQNYSRNVDRRFCSCSCWDTVFKGTYETGVASYKHMYFNATTNTTKIWLLIVFGIISLYECIKYLYKLMLQHKLRYSMLSLFLLSIFPHYYAWWACINYYNDEFYDQWSHQMFFTVTEIFSTILVLNLANKDNEVTSRKVLAISGIGVLHIMASGFDQFLANVFGGEGYAHQVVRDIGFMIPDVSHVCLPLMLLRGKRREEPFYRDRNLRKDIVITIILISILFFFCSFL